MKIGVSLRLTDLLMVVAHWTGFVEMLIHASTNRPPKGEEKFVLISALMAIGTNIGLPKKAVLPLMLPIIRWQMLHNGDCMMIIKKEQSLDKLIVLMESLAIIGLTWHKLSFQFR
ncbi:hypothetical protein J2S10_005139 [Neobacillus ginsengisoli]|uniref:Tn3 transposase DDE domain-containing protein n=1 Tax=Neobacillus ginsengisoli TaxID=904295 RepID=A0ABT9Y2Q2_9BACI|nr:hypothetical protein [Neobacillus ginsengisoli]